MSCNNVWWEILPGFTVTGTMIYVLTHTRHTTTVITLTHLSRKTSTHSACHDLPPGKQLSSPLIFTLYTLYMCMYRRCHFSMINHLRYNSPICICSFEGILICSTAFPWVAMYSLHRVSLPVGSFSIFFYYLLHSVKVLHFCDAGVVT